MVYVSEVLIISVVRVIIVIVICLFCLGCVNVCSYVGFGVLFGSGIWFSSCVKFSIRGSWIIGFILCMLCRGVLVVFRNVCIGWVIGEVSLLWWLMVSSIILINSIVISWLCVGIVGLVSLVSLVVVIR